MFLFFFSATESLTAACCNAVYLSTMEAGYDSSRSNYEILGLLNQKKRTKPSNNIVGGGGRGPK